MDAPSMFEAAVLVLGTYRVLRFLGWDEWPPVAQLRARMIGEAWVPLYGHGSAQDATELGLPGKPPSSEVDAVRPAYARPTLAHLVHCPFCLGAYLSLTVFVFWLLVPGATVVVLAAPALSGAIGLISKVLDA